MRPISHRDLREVPKKKEKESKRKVLIVCLCFCCCTSKHSSHITQNVQAILAEETFEKLKERGQAFAAVGDLTRAEQYFAAALEKTDDYQQILPLLLRVCIEGKRYRVALDYAEPMLQRNPMNHSLRFVIGSLYNLTGDYKTAQFHFEKVVLADPNNPNPHYVLAVLFRDNLKKPLAADMHFREYLRLDPNGLHSEEARASLLKEIKEAQ
ncbi:tetratricopeptide repeat protein [Pajaroellobacter abortibovis]|uniref:Uncharacterized protein n=1 Tax=Pajaroellobacter abortibovis TaxID=1882918 RepID=A0A1L6MYE4_9BACT|nr:hypothetical protein [Pajaroellobacter abortibovis]APS00532.1 hypothetical protein BCY86_07475 [Pajaroellobacter abortibovis]